MYIIPIKFPETETHTVQVQLQLSKEGLVVDERVIPFEIEYITDEEFEFQCVIEGTTLTVTAIEEEYESLSYLIWLGCSVYFRVYDPEIEEVPDFTDESYIYHGLWNEKPPPDVKEVIVHPSVTIIQEEAFKLCDLMERCIMGDSVKRIEAYAFAECHSLRSIRLSRALQYIDGGAFYESGIECLFIPPSVEDIQDMTFSDFDDLKILVLPPSIDLEQASHYIIDKCPKLKNSCEEYYRRTNPDIDKEQGYRKPDTRQINHWLKHRYDHLPLIRLCADPDISAPMIRDFIQMNGTAAFYHTDDDYGLTPLHILTRYNGFASKDVIVTCYDANPSALITPDGEGNTPLTNLWWGKKDVNDDVLDLIVQLVHNLCVHRRQSQEANFKRTNVGKRKREDEGNTAPVS